MNLEKTTATELLPRLARRELTAEALVRACLERIEAREPEVQAWAHLDRTAVIAAAKELDRGAIRGPLHGLPVGVKDVIDTFDLPTEYGSPIYAGHRPLADAAVVALARLAGALVLGKTVTTEFATFPPGKTRNPHHPGHTPGGSSSGSAAAVAAAMVPVAFGTQTTGSIIRPASFCGATGFKPSFGTLSRVGVKAISECLDTVGVFARSVADAALFAGVLARRAFTVPSTVPAPRIGWCRTFEWSAAQPETQKLFAREFARAGPAGGLLREIDLPAPFAGLAQAQGVIWEFEMARCLTDEHRRNAERIREPLRSQLARGFDTSVAHYDAAMSLASDCRGMLSDLMREFDALIVPSAPGEAPRGLEATGNPVFNRIWSLLHTPCVHVPTATGPNGLPLGLQVVGRIGDDARALACAHWLQSNLPVEPL